MDTTDILNELERRVGNLSWPDRDWLRLQIDAVRLTERERGRKDMARDLRSLLGAKGD